MKAQTEVRIMVKALLLAYLVTGAALFAVAFLLFQLEPEEKITAMIPVKEYKQGKGNVIRRMFREIDAEVYIMVDGDDTYPAEEVEGLITPVLEGKADMVIGDRLSSTYYTENKRPFHNFGNSLVKGLINFLFIILSTLYQNCLV